MTKIKVAMLASYSPFSKDSGFLTHVNKLTTHLSYRDDIELHIITVSNKNRRFKKENLVVHEIKKTFP